MSVPLLDSLDALPVSVERPTYDPSKHGAGIVHLGLGAFHRSHQAFYTDAAMRAAGGDWRIVAASLRDTLIPEQLNAQNGLYTLMVNHPQHRSSQVIASIQQGIAASLHPEWLLNTLGSANIRIVSVTVTEKGYSINRATGLIDRECPIIAHDLMHAESPRGVIGFLVRALQRRYTAGLPPFTILCCDNLPDNGAYLKRGVLDFATQVDEALAHWISDKVLFPASMVDRITPAQTPDTLLAAEHAIGHRDLLAIETEPFHQWVIEDTFNQGRPEWEAAGAIFTADVSAFERMKLRMLNGAHSMIAYGGFLTDHAYVRDVMADEALSVLVARHLDAAAATLKPVPGMNLVQYAEELIERFANPSIAHATRQIAADGSQKLPQRLFAPALDAMSRNQPVRPFAFATALWMHYCRGIHDNGRSHVVEDPLASHIQSTLSNNTSEDGLAQLSSINGLIPPELAAHDQWTDDVLNTADALQRIGTKATLKREAEYCRQSGVSSLLLKGH